MKDEEYQDYQDNIKLLLRLFIKNFGRIQLMHKFGRMTTRNTAEFLNITYMKASTIRSLYKQWSLGSFDI